ncbi:Uncharacterised protein [Mycobacteroides abscessus subsp. abscessus]|nr:Uncharacterised protein [Mycobacteroides abscessus subsp. abscessus]
MLQWVSTRSGRGPHRRCTRSAAWVAAARLTRPSSASMSRVSASTASAPSAMRGRTRSTAQARLTAVGRAAAIRSASARTAATSTMPSRVCARVASTTAKAPAIPMAGAPRIASVLIASMI